MGMSVQTNMQAAFASRYVGMSAGRLAKSSEKLSSGYRINRAADDAAGLAISEKLRRQVRGLSQGSKNVQEGVSLCQVADGALSEVTAMLHRMTELSVKAANATLDAEDRDAIQQEIRQLSLEISRVGKNTTFNENPIFDDPIGGPRFREEHLVSSPAADSGHLTESYQTLDGQYHPAATLDFSNVNAGTIGMLDGKSFSFTCSAACAEAFEFTFDNTIPYSASSASDLNGTVTHKYVIGIDGTTSGSELVSHLYDFVSTHMPNGNVPAPNGELLVSHSNYLSRMGADKLALYSYRTFPTAAEAESFYQGSTSPYGAVNSTDLVGITYQVEDRGIWIQSGTDPWVGMNVEIGRMNADIIGVGDVDVRTVAGANAGIEKIENALQVISKERANIGAQQNRLEHALNNNEATVENTQAAESRLRDADMSKELMEHSIQNILQQAGQNMLAQANQNAGMVLSLLS